MKKAKVDLAQSDPEALARCIEEPELWEERHVRSRSSYKRFLKRFFIFTDEQWLRAKEKIDTDWLDMTNY